MCANCGQYSADYDVCDSCKKPLPENVKFYAPQTSTSSPRKKPRLDGPPAGDGKQTTGKNNKLATAMQLEGDVQNKKTVNIRVVYMPACKYIIRKKVTQQIHYCKAVDL